MEECRCFVSCYTKCEDNGETRENIEILSKVLAQDVEDELRFFSRSRRKENVRLGDEE